MSDADQSLFTRRTLWVSITLVLFSVGVLYLLGRPAWCKYGLGFWTAAWTRCTSQHFLDPYTLTHVLHGVLFYWLLWPFANRVILAWRQVAALALEVGWEILENSPWVIARYRQQTAALDYTGDSILNVVGDILPSIIGFCLASRFSWKISVAVFIIFELLALYLARDNLTLNILMLFFPLDAVKDWQLDAMQG